ncbi:MAG: T9SS type A sorting domain-containing protein [Elusimicrobia bacterium]|nr:T9SS type A sorting domain-containing protein [Candidatus Obscuribacterium magneticum]
MNLRFTKIEKAVVPAKAGTRVVNHYLDSCVRRNDGRRWIPAFAGMTARAFAGMAALAFLVPTLAFAAGPAAVLALPQAVLDTTYSLPTGGKTWTVNQGDDLQSVINSANLGDVIVVQAGATFTGQYVLPNKTGTGWVYIISSALSSLPEGERVGPSDTANMAKIVAPAAWRAAIRADWGAHNYRFAGIEITTNYNQTDVLQYGLVKLGYNANSQVASTLSNLADNIIFDRVYLHGTATGNNRDGIFACVRRLGIVDSYVSDFHAIGNDNQGIHVYYGAGPIAITNNYIEAAGINLFLGDSGPMNYDLLPQDVTIRGNYLYKPLAWKVGDPSYGGIHWTVKNLFEIKGGRRILAEGNVLENSWVDSQTGWGVLVTPMGGPIDDVTIQNNILRGCDHGFQLSPDDVTINRLALKNNLIYDITGILFGAAAFQLDTYENLIINHNTAIHSGVGSGVFYLGVAGIEPAIQNVSFQNNLMTHGAWGIAGQNVGIGFVPVDTYITNYSFDKNVLIGGLQDGRYGDRPNFTNFYLPQTMGAVGFTNTALSQPADFALLPSSPYHNLATDGKDIGANIDAVLAATANVITGGGTPPPPTTPNPPGPSPVSPIASDVGPERNVIHPSIGSVTNIGFTCDKPANVEINIYNRQGRVKGPLQGECAAGTNSFSWDGKNEDGGKVASGIYVVKIKAGDKLLTKKVAVLR